MNEQMVSKCGSCGDSVYINSDGLKTECACDKQRMRERRVVIGLQLLLIGFLIGLIVGRALGSW